MRAILATTFSLGMALAGCGPTASVPVSRVGSTGVAATTRAIQDANTPRSEGNSDNWKAERAAEVKGEVKDVRSSFPDVVLTEEEIAEIKTLPDAADQRAALAQKGCPVGEEEEGKPNHLGSMGKPIKQVVRGKTVFLCCKGCIEELSKDPEKYLSKLGK